MKLNRVMIIALLAIIANISICRAQNLLSNSKGVVDSNGWLSVSNTHLVNDKDEVVDFRGVSMGWHNWWGKYFNENVVTTLSQDWKAQIIRVAIGVGPDNSYLQNPKYALSLVDSMVRAAIKNNIYVLIDWHSHGNHLKEATEFFEIVSKKYGSYPNVLFETWNEPEEVKWKEIKDYSEAIIKVIRENAPKSIILVGTPRWDQDVDKAAENPILGEKNIMYSLHFYAATHKGSFIKKAEYAIKKGLPIFISECANMNHLGQGNMDIKSWNNWMAFAKKNNLSVIMWSIGDKDETCSMLTPGTSENSKEWKESNIKPWGKFVRDFLQSNNVTK